MRGKLPITVDLETLQVELGRFRMSLIATQHERLFQVSDTGDLVRLLTFEERTVVVMQALLCEQPDAALLGLLGGGSERGQAVALALAGGGESTPTFAEIESMYRGEGDAPALLVDKEFARDREERGTGWTEIFFTPPDELSDLIAGMLENLFARGVSVPQIETREDKPTDSTQSSTCARSPISKLHRGYAALQFESDYKHLQGRSTSKATSPTQSESDNGYPNSSTPEAVSPPEPLDILEHSSASTTAPRLRFRIVEGRGQAGRSSDAKVHEGMGVRASFQEAAPTQSVPTPEAVGVPMQGRLFNGWTNRNHTAVGAASELPRVELPKIEFPKTPHQAWSDVATGTSTGHMERIPLHVEEEHVPESRMNLFSPVATDWLEELALLLETECDLRGLDA